MFSYHKFVGSSKLNLKLVQYETNQKNGDLS